MMRGAVNRCLFYTRVVSMLLAPPSPSLTRHTKHCCLLVSFAIDELIPGPPLLPFLFPIRDSYWNHAKPLRDFRQRDSSRVQGHVGGGLFCHRLPAFVFFQRAVLIFQRIPQLFSLLCVEDLPTSISSASNAVIPRPPLVPPLFPSPHSLLIHTEPRCKSRLRDIRVLCQRIPQLPSLLIGETTPCATNEVIPRPPLLPLCFALRHRGCTHTELRPNSRQRDIRVFCQRIPQLPSLLIGEIPPTNSASNEVISRPALLPLRFVAQRFVLIQTKPRPNSRHRDIRVLCERIPQLTSVLRAEILPSQTSFFANNEVIPRPTLLPPRFPFRHGRPTQT